MDYQDFVDCHSETLPGVRFRIARMSFARRLDLTCKVRDLLARLEFMDAKPGSQEEVAASLLRMEVDGIYLQWGLLDLQGLCIEQARTPYEIALQGPEALAREIISRIKAETGLSETERKN